ncbi:MAG: hypothetical protein KDD51_04690, partial [Bdellovibrionales bacterium]|nr:hypothetical protein [Bdellovibrionales bacterium]
RLNSPRTPEAFLITSTYQGSLDLGGEIGKVKMGHDFSAFFPESDPLGTRLLVRLYNLLENVEEPAFSCIKEKICEVVESENDLILSWPKLSLLISKDRKVLYRMMLLNGVAQGKLDNDLDVLQGAFHFAEGDIQLGESWGSIIEKLGINSATNTGTTLFTKDYSGIVLGMNKSHFEREYLEPEASERLRVVAVYTGFKQKLTLGGKFIKLVDEGDKVALSLVEGPSSDDRLVELKMNLPKAQQVPFIKALGELIAKELEDSAPGSIVVQRLSGLHADSPAKEYGLSLIHFVAGRGVSLYFELRESTGNLGYVEVARLEGSVDEAAAVAVSQAVDVKQKRLAGVELGETLAISDIDVGRGEATAERGGETYRADYTENAILEGVYEGGKLESHRVSVLRLGNLRATLGVVPIGEVENGRVLVRVVSVSSSAHAVGTSNLCGLSDLVLRPGTKDTVLKAQIDAAITTRKAMDGDFTCRYVVQEDPNATNRIIGIFFPEDHAKLSLAEREFTSTTLYSRVQGGQQ